MKEHLLLDYIIKFEGDELEPNKVIDLFSYLIKHDRLRGLQGFYGRFAKRLIEQGYLDNSGNILKHYEENKNENT